MPSTDQLIAAAGQHLAQAQREQALALLETAVAQDPRHPHANLHLGMVRGTLGDMAGAESAFRAAVALNPRSTDAHACLGMLLSNRQRAGEAEASLRTALSLSPARSDIVYPLSRLLTETGRAEESIAVIRAAQQLNPADAFLQDKLCMMLNYVDGISDDQLLREHVRYGQLAPRPDFNSSAIDRSPDRRLRIAYLSADLREHSVAYFLEPLLERHDRRDFEIFCYHLGPGDSLTPRLQSKADVWRALFPCPDETLLSAIRADRIDILIELAGHTSSNRLPVVARRVAPIQVTYIGYPNTTGLPSVDYRIVDSITDPPGAEKYCTERLVRIDPCFLCYRAPDSAPDVSPSSPRSGVSFASFNNLAKLSPQSIALWSRILLSIPNSRLILKGKALSDTSIASSFLARFAAHSIAPDRLDFLPHTPSTREHLAAYSQVDIALDPFPYAGTTTTCEALWQGVPVITLANSTRHASRVGLSLLSTLGLTDLIASSPDHYHSLALSLASNPARLADLRQTLRPRLAQSPLCDAAAFTPKLESAFRAMWHAFTRNTPV